MSHPPNNELLRARGANYALATEKNCDQSTESYDNPLEVEEITTEERDRLGEGACNGPTFTFSQEGANGARTGSIPDLVIRMSPDGKQLEIEGSGEAAAISDFVIANFVSSAILVADRLPREVSVHVSYEGLNAGQVDAIHMLGVKALYWGSSKDPPKKTSKEQPNDKQQKWNHQYEAVRRAIEEGGEDRLELNSESHEKWLEAVERYLEYALVEEAKHGLDETLDLFEAVRHYCLGAGWTLPVAEGKTAKPTPKFLIEYAGCLARLASCVDLRDYDRSKGMHPETADRNRNDDFFASAIKMYEEAEELFGEDASDRQQFLVTSGLAHARALRALYLMERAQRLKQTLGIMVDRDEVPKACTQATEELEAIREKIAPGPLVGEIDEQIADIREFRLGHGASGEEKVPVADRVLLELVAA